MEKVPECCVLGDKPSLAERLYVTWCRGSHGKLGWVRNILPSWATLQAERALGYPTSTADVARWEALAQYMETVMVHLNLWTVDPGLRVELPTTPNGKELLTPADLQDVVRGSLALREPDLAGLLHIQVLTGATVTRPGRYNFVWAVCEHGAPNNWATIYIVRARKGSTP